MALIFSLMLTLLYCVVYLALRWLFPYFFSQPRPAFNRHSLINIALIVLLSFLAYALSYVLPNANDSGLGNRVLHGFGGGFLAFLMCFLVARDTHIKITKFQFFLFSVLIVTTLGVGNELLEFFLQSTTGYIFSPTTTDTWADLTSNTVGLLIASACLTPFVRSQ